MVIDLKKFFLSDDQEESWEFELDLSEVELGGVKPFCAPIKVWAAVKSFAGSAVFESRLAYRMTMPCDRCSEVTEQEFLRCFTHTLVRELSGEDDEDYVVVSGEKLDVDQLLTEDILLDVPSKFLCSPDCRGLCPVCGKNRNLEDCGCERPEIDPRLAALQKLLDDR